MFGRLCQLASVMALALVATIPRAEGADWPVHGQNLHNTRHNVDERAINKKNVKKLKLKWSYRTAAPGSPGDVRAVPVLVDDTLYVGDELGLLHGIDTNTGQPINNNWPVNLPPLSQSGKALHFTRTPAIYGSKLIVSGNKTFSQAAESVCFFDQDPLADNCVPRDGAIVSAIDRFSGQLIWSTRVETFYASRITAAPVVYNGIAYVGVSSGEENSTKNAVRASIVERRVLGSDLNSPYPCCGHKGAVVALDADTGQILWKTYLAPLDGPPQPNQLQPDAGQEPIPILNHTVFVPTHVAADYTGDLGSYDGGFSGVSVWGSSFVVDAERGDDGRLYIGTSNGYMAPDDYVRCRHFEIDPGAFNHQAPAIAGPLKPVLEQALQREVQTCDDVTLAEINEALGFYPDAVLALNLVTGAIERAYFIRDYDVWTFSCTPSENGLGSVLDFRTRYQPGTGRTVMDQGKNVLGCPTYYAGEAQHEPRLAGLDAALAQAPFLVLRGSKGIIGAADKDGIFVALDADTFEPLEGYRNRSTDPESGKTQNGIDLGPGSILGGVHLNGVATDGRRAFAAIANWINAGRDIRELFVPSLFDVKRPHEDPSNDDFQINDFLPRDPGFFGRVLDSGPKDLWVLVNPPNDVKVDGKGKLQFKFGVDAKEDLVSGCVIDDFEYAAGVPQSIPPAVVRLTQVAPECQDRAQAGDIVTISGIWTAVDLKNGVILWQRPTPPVLPDIAENTPTPLRWLSSQPDDHRGRGLVYGGGATVANGVLYSAVMDQQGSFVGLDAKTGEMQFRCHAKFDGAIGGDISAAPIVANGNVIFAAGEPFGSTPFVRANGVGNAIYAFHLGEEAEDADAEIFCETL